MSHDHDRHLDDAGPDWARLERALGRVAPEPVTEFDVARLRHSVRRSIESRRKHFWTRAAASAAAVVVGALSLYGTLDRHTETIAPRNPTAAAKAVPVKVVLADDGSTILQFDGSRTTHRIVTSDVPVPGKTAEVKIAKGQRFVDRTERPRPGEVIFYRID